MATDALEIRMARLEGACEPINERLAGVERDLSALRAELKAEFASLRAEFGSLRTESGSLRSELRSEVASLRADTAHLRRQVQTQFYWTLTLILGAVLFPVLRDLALTR